MAASFPLIVRVAIRRKNNQTTLRAELTLTFFSISQGSKTVRVAKNTKLVVINAKMVTTLLSPGTFVLPIYTFSLAENVFVYKPSQVTNTEKHFLNISNISNVLKTYQTENAAFGQNQKIFHPFPS